MTLLRHFDLVALAAALPVFVLAGLPLVAYGAAAAAWLAQTALKVVLERRAAASTDPRFSAGVTLASMMARVWLSALAILAVGLSTTDEAGLAAAVLIAVLFTIHLSMLLVLRGPGGGRGESA
jgi:hypothetical protein